jgi:hypothetical protein
MSSNPEAIHEARRAATIERLVGFGMLRRHVERWLALYEADHDAREGRWPSTYWDDAYRHVMERYEAGDRPPLDGD